MPKFPNSKLRLLYVADYIRKYSDEDNGFFIKDIQEHLASKGIKAEYHSITDDINLLRDHFGMDISGGGGKGRPFYLISQYVPFEDLSAIAECIGAAGFLSEERAKGLTDILKVFCSIYQEQEIDRDYFVVERPRETRKDLLDTLVIIRDAIKQNQKIHFKYTTRKLKGFSRVYRRKGEDYKVSPYEVVLAEGNHYLIGYDEKTKKAFPFRVDRMEGIGYLYEPREGKEKVDALGIRDYARQTFGMFVGPEPKRLTLICDNSILDNIIERFGTGRGVDYKKYDEEHFTITTLIVSSPVFYGWLFGFGGKVIIQDSGEDNSIAKKYLDYLEMVKRKTLESIE